LNEDGLKTGIEFNHSNTAKNSGIEITIPNLGVRKFLVWESSNFEPELQAKYPDIRAYAE
jgi:hypothetical protein